MQDTESKNGQYKTHKFPLEPLTSSQLYSGSHTTRLIMGSIRTMGIHGHDRLWVTPEEVLKHVNFLLELNKLPPLTIEDVYMVIEMWSSFFRLLHEERITARGKIKYVIANEFYKEGMQLPV